MVKYTQTIRRQFTICLSVFDHFVGLRGTKCNMANISLVSHILQLTLKQQQDVRNEGNILL